MRYGVRALVRVDVQVACHSGAGDRIRRGGAGTDAVGGSPCQSLGCVAALSLCRGSSRTVHEFSHGGLGDGLQGAEVATADALLAQPENLLVRGVVDRNIAERRKQPVHSLRDDQPRGTGRLPAAHG